MRKQRAFSLLEIVVALTLLVMITLSLQGVFTAAVRTWRKAEGIAQAGQIARAVLDRMSGEIQSALITEPFTQFRLFARPATRSGSISNELYFIAAVKPSPADDMSDLCEVGYWLDGHETASAQDDELRRFYVCDDRRIQPVTPEFDFDFDTPTGRTNSDQLELDISELEFQFFATFADYQNNSFTSSWNSSPNGILPAIIRIRIRVGVGRGTAETNRDFFATEFVRVINMSR